MEMVELKARLIPCNFKDKDGNELFRVVIDHNEKVGSDEIAGATAEKTRLDRPLVEIISKTLDGVMMGELAKGKRVETEYFSIFISCRGRFRGFDDSFDPSRHHLKVCIRPKAKAREMLGGIRVTNVLLPVTAAIAAVRSAGVEADDTVRLGADFYVNGKNLRLAAEHADEGIFLVDGEGATRASAAVGESDVGTANGRFAEGAVEPGDYTLEVRTRNGNGLSRRLAVARRTVKVIA